MTGWIEFAAAMALFLISHRLPAWLGVKGWLQARLGAAGYIALFSVLSVALLWWLILAAGRAPFVPLWDQQVWHRWAVNLAMPVVGLLAVFGVGAANPFAFEGRAEGYDPYRPGIAGLTRQPLLWALAIWAGVHLLPNGDVAHVLLFAPMLVFSLAGMGIVERRRRRAMGAAEWQRLTARTGLVPLAALLSGRWRPQGPPSLVRLAIWAIAWALVWHLHAPVIGVWPGV
ncbi:MAG: NnrU family protein [Fuscovulum sp.]|nr:NnrU family protein [Fuscovulum sp.]